MYINGVGYVKRDMAGIANGDTNFYMTGKDIKSISKGEYTESVDSILTPIFDNLQGWLDQGCKGYHNKDIYDFTLSQINSYLENTK